MPVIYIYITPLQTGLDEVTPGHTIPSQVSANLQQELGVILKIAADLADSSRTRDSRQHTIISQSGSLKAGLRTLMLLGEGRAEIRRESLEVTRRHSTTLKQEVSEMAGLARDKSITTTQLAIFSSYHY